MTPILIICPSTDTVTMYLTNQGVNLTGVDTIIAPPTPRLGIAFIRQIKSFLATAPISAAFKSVIVLDAHRLTLPAQNAFLKTLEEPPPYARIYLSVTQRDQLLPTIISRCLIEPLKVTPTATLVNPALSALIDQLAQSAVGARVTLAGPYAKNRDTALEICQNLIETVRHEQFSRPDSATARRLALLHDATVRLQANANPHLVLEHLFIHWND